MRYYSYNEPVYDNHGNGPYDNVVVTISEEQIKEQYYPYWYERMCKKFGKEVVDEKY